MYKTLYLLLFLFPLNTYSQRINNNISYRDMAMNSYFRLSYDNDYFTKTDRYYTQGINAEWVNPVFSKNPLNFLLLKSRTKPVNYGIGADHFGFTPTSIKSNEVLQGDGHLQVFKPEELQVIMIPIIAVFIRPQFFWSIGPWAGGEGMQKEFTEQLVTLNPRLAKPDWE